MFLSGLEPDAEDRQIQQIIAGSDRRHEQQHRDLQASRKLFQEAIPDCNIYWENCLSQSWKKFKNLRRDQKSSKRTTTTSLQSLVMLLRRIAAAVPNMDFLNEKECTTRLKICCEMLAKKSTEAIHPHLHGGTTTTNAENRCHWLDGPSKI